MKQRLATYIAELLVNNGITQNFTVVGGGAMHLNDAFGHQKGMTSLYQHHEQACAMAAESYARIYNRPALLCVTTGPGGTNAITGVLGAWLDSLPMLVISGQVRYDNTARWSGVGIRAMGDQEFDILKAVSCMTKYSEMLIDPYRVRYAVEKCIYLCQTGRPGPCWLDIPVNIQGMMIETRDLPGFDPVDYERGGSGFADCPEEDGRKHFETAGELQNFCADSSLLEEKKRRYQLMANPHLLPGDAEDSQSQGAKRETGWEKSEEKLREYARLILDRIRQSRRPVFYTGNGIRIAGAEALFLSVMHILNIPVVVSWNAPDIIPTDDPLYVGRPGGRGDRPGNLLVQNADFILSIGSRLNIRQVGYNFSTWAREAYVIVNDIDAEELKKPSVHADVRIHADARMLLKALRDELAEQGIEKLFSGGEGILLPDALSIIHTETAEALLRGLREREASESGHGTMGTAIASDASKRRLSWLETAAFYRENYPTVLQEYKEDTESVGEGGRGGANLYAVMDVLSDLSKEGQITVVGNGSPCVAGGQAWRVKKGARFISQDAVASMGYGLPAAIGAWAALQEEAPEVQGRKNPFWAGLEEAYPDYGRHDILLLTGDGSIQMNLQELQTIIHHRMGIKIFVINNGGYHSIRQTQNNFFGKPLVGIGIDSGVDGKQDLSFPDMEKLAAAYGFPFMRVSSNSALRETFQSFLSLEGPAICEIIVSTEQEFLPKSAARRLPDGSLISPPLEDLSPFLPEEEMKKLMLVKPVH